MPVPLGAPADECVSVSVQAEMSSPDVNGAFAEHERAVKAAEAAEGVDRDRWDEEQVALAILF